jgi:nucleotide-binding universal stress UspA family protein
VLLAVDDSAAALAAARCAIDLATRLDARVRMVSVVTDGVLTAALSEASSLPDLEARRDAAAHSVLRHVAHLARRAGVEAETATLEGEPAACILAEAGGWGADFIVLGRGDGGHLGEPAIRPGVARVIDFAEQPVIVVPTGAAMESGI